MIYEFWIDKVPFFALNCGMDNYRTLRFSQLERFDYGPEECLQFHDSIEKVVLPLIRERSERRREQLGLDQLRPWDSAVDPMGRSPLRPLEKGTDLIDGCRQVFGKVHPDLEGMFNILIDGDLLDLESRKGKAPGGYQACFHEIRKPFIFMNAAGKRSGSSGAAIIGGSIDEKKPRNRIAGKYAFLGSAALSPGSDPPGCARDGGPWTASRGSPRQYPRASGWLPGWYHQRSTPAPYPRGPARTGHALPAGNAH